MQELKVSYDTSMKEAAKRKTAKYAELIRVQNRSAAEVAANLQVLSCDYLTLPASPSCAKHLPTRIKYGRLVVDAAKEAIKCSFT